MKWPDLSGRVELLQVRPPALLAVISIDISIKKVRIALATSSLFWNDIPASVQFSWLQSKHGNYDSFAIRLIFFYQFDQRKVI